MKEISFFGATSFYIFFYFASSIRRVKKNIGKNFNNGDFKMMQMEAVIKSRLAAIVVAK